MRDHRGRLLLLFFIGAVSCLSSKVKNKCLTVGFLVFSAVQLVALIANLALLLGIMTKLFSVDDLPVRLTYILTTAVVLVGYVASISYFSDNRVSEIAEEEADGEEEEEESAEDSADVTDEIDAAEETAETDFTEEVEEVEEVDEVDEVEEVEEVQDLEKL